MQAKRLKSSAYGIALGAVVAQVQSLPSTFHRSELRRKLKRGLPRQTAVGVAKAPRHAQRLPGPPPRARRWVAETVRYL